MAGNDAANVSEHLGRIGRAGQPDIRILLGFAHCRPPHRRLQPRPGGCRVWGAESENRPQRGQFLPDLQAHSPTMGQKDGEKWTAAVGVQPAIRKSDSLLDDAMGA